MPKQQKSIIYPDAVCINNTTHHFIQIGTEIYWCDKCYKAKWQPVSLNLALIYRSAVDKKLSYSQFIEARPDLYKLLSKLDELRQSLFADGIDAIAIPAKVSRLVAESNTIIVGSKLDTQSAKVNIGNYSISVVEDFRV